MVHEELPGESSAPPSKTRCWRQLGCDQAVRVHSEGYLLVVGIVLTWALKSSVR